MLVVRALVVFALLASAAACKRGEDLDPTQQELSPDKALGPGEVRESTGLGELHVLDRFNPMAKLDKSFDRVTLQDLENGTYDQESMKVEKGLTFGLRSANMEEKRITGYAKFEVTRIVEGQVEFRYVYWPLGSDQGEERSGFLNPGGRGGNEFVNLEDNTYTSNQDRNYDSELEWLY